MRHHYVPQFLLRAWSDGTPDKKIETFRLDLTHLPSSRFTPKHTGYEDDLYALSLPVVASMEQHAVEKHVLQHVDNLAARVRLKMEVSGLKSLSIDERSDWVRFVVSLRLRQPEMVLHLKNDATTHLRKTLRDSPGEYEALAESGEPPTLEEWTEQRFPGLIENFGLSFFHKLIADVDIGEDIFRMKWWLWDFSRTGRKLILADRPCILTSALKSPDCMLALPISPIKAFLARAGSF